ncbi:hypothetical protein BGX21_003894 [Mortierella sp. AD011]|nr:hypothetical protein BGX20_003866 [Mortierella sp. AD010]KAF9375055.1 hypothetical protein BGX21_003894 [Mortierella sp. AD011]
MHLSWSRAFWTTAYSTTTTVVKARTGTTFNRLLANRRLWTAATCSHSDLATALSRCLPAPSSTQPPSANQGKDSVTIVLASRSYPGSDLLSLPSKVPPHISQSSFVLGAVVDRVPTKSGHGVSTLTLSPTSTTSSPSTGFDQLISCKPFYLSGAESRRKRLKEKSVGKWARSQDIEERRLDTPDAWSAFKTISIGYNQVQVPKAALPSDSSSGSTSQDILMISDLEVHQFLEALDNASPEANKVGLLASSTPFITGRPVTMFYDGKIVQDGVLGVSVVRDAKDGKGVENRASVEYPTLVPLGPAMQITRCRGNIILELDESNATRLLLDRLKTTTLTKDKEYFLATSESIESTQSQDVNIDMSKATVYKITGGDPSKGNMAVDTVNDLNVGQWVQFIHHGKTRSDGHYDPSYAPESKQGLIRFTTSDPNNTIEQHMEEEPKEIDSENPIRALFGGSSENGFIVGQPNDHTWRLGSRRNKLTP